MCREGFLFLRVDRFLMSYRHSYGEAGHDFMLAENSDFGLPMERLRLMGRLRGFCSSRAGHSPSPHEVPPPYFYTFRISELQLHTSFLRANFVHTAFLRSYGLFPPP